MKGSDCAVTEVKDKITHGFCLMTEIRTANTSESEQIIRLILGIAMVTIYAGVSRKSRTEAIAKYTTPNKSV
jgi:hypothetical protein